MISPQLERPYWDGRSGRRTVFVLNGLLEEAVVLRLRAGLLA